MTPRRSSASFADLGADLHPGLDRRGAGGRVAAPALDLDQTQPAGAEGLEAVGGAELGDPDADRLRGAHDRGPLGDRDREAVDVRGRPSARCAGRGAEIGFAGKGHGLLQLSRAGISCRVRIVGSPAAPRREWDGGLATLLRSAAACRTESAFTSRQTWRSTAKRQSPQPTAHPEVLREMPQRRQHRIRRHAAQGAE